VNETGGQKGKSQGNERRLGEQHPTTVSASTGHFNLLFFLSQVWLAFFGCPIYSYRETPSAATEANGSNPLYVLITDLSWKIKALHRQVCQSKIFKCS